MMRAHASTIAQALGQKAHLHADGSESRGHAVAPARSHVVVVGFTCAGKSIIARQLGVRTGRSVVDLEELVVKESGMAIAELLRRQGRVALLAKERALLRELLMTLRPCIIAAGSETFCDPTIRGWLKERAATVYLDVSVATVITRLGARAGGSARPGHTGPELRETLERQLKAVQPLYREATLTVGNDGVRVEDVVDEIVRAMHLERNDPARHAPARRLV